MRRRLAAFLFGGIAVLAVGEASAMGLGAATVHSALGEPLRLTFPVSARPDEDIGCIQLRAKGDDLPSVLNARTSVIRNGFQTRVEVRSAQPIDEPAIGFVVSVGCTSPISRQYVVFLDPPVIAPLAAASESPVVQPAPAPQPVRRPATRRPKVAGAEPAQRSDGVAARGSAARTPRTQTAAPRPPRLQAPAAPATTPDALQVPAAAASSPAPVVPAPVPAPTRDRLTVAPSGAPATATVTPPAVAGAVAPAVMVGAPAVPVVGEAGEAAAAREQALRQQQADLQQQIKALSDQIAALRVQTTSLVTRNEMLERSSFSPLLVWLLIALAALAIAVAGWMAWRYTQLRKSIEGSAWWTANTTHAVVVDPLDEAEADDGLPPLDLPTRMPPRMPPRVTMPVDVRASAAPAPQTAAVVSNLERSRPVAPRNTRYPAAIDTDFTVSDIEAAMAAVRTVSPPREQPRPQAVEDSDFAPLGGQTRPSPFAEPPAPTPPSSARTGKVVERDGDDIGKFVDLEIPPLPAAVRHSAMSRTPGPVVADPFDPAPKKPVAGASPAEAEIAPLDFKLDIPQTFDPLATDSMKTTVVDRAAPADAVDLELSGSPTPLDFELPSATSFATTETGSGRFADDPPLRHGATALDDLFPALGGPGADTILELDEPDHGSPLSTTEVDRLLTTAVDGSNAMVVEAPTRARLARFADLMNQVDDAAVADPLRAIAQLRQFVLRDEQIPTLLWLRLFELYKAVDKKPVYEALAEHFSRRYHRPMTGWTQTLADRVPQKPLSAMGAIDNEIEALWGTDAGLERIRSLLCDRDQDDAVVFNAVLQRDLLDAAKVFPPSGDALTGTTVV